MWGPQGIDSRGNYIPIITHTKYLNVHPIDLETVIETINDAAFITSSFPVILSIENNMNYECQAVAAKLLRKHFGDKLFDEKDYLKAQKDNITLRKLQNKILVLFCKTNKL